MILRFRSVPGLCVQCKQTFVDLDARIIAKFTEPLGGQSGLLWLYADIAATDSGTPEARTVYGRHRVRVTPREPSLPPGSPPLRAIYCLTRPLS